MSKEIDCVNEREAASEEARSSEECGMDISLTLIEILTPLAHRKQLVATITVIGFMAGLLYCLIVQPRYLSTVKLMPPQQAQSASSLLMSQAIAGGASGASMFAAASGLALKNPSDNYVVMLSSRPVADAIIRKFGLAGIYRSKDQTAARKELAERTEIVADKSGFITISVTDTDKRRGAAIANEYPDELRILMKSIVVTEAAQRRLFYEEQLVQAKDALVAAEAALQQVEQNKGLVQLDAQARAIVQGLANMRAQVAAKEVEVQALRLSATENNPALQVAERELVSLQEEETRLEQRNHSGNFANLGMADVPSAGLDYLRAEHEVRYRQTMFDLLIKQYDVAKLDEAKDAAVIQVLEPGIEAERKSSPKRTLTLLFTTLSGFFAACLVVLFLWWRDLMRSNAAIVRSLGELKLALHPASQPKA